MSLRGQDVPIYESTMTPEQKELALKSLSDAVRKGFAATGKKSLIQKTLNQSETVTATIPTVIGILSSAFNSSQGYTEITARVPFTLAGGATAIAFSLLVDGIEVDRISGSTSPLSLSWSGIPSAGGHLVQVQAWVNAGTATLFGPNSWGNLSIVETLL